jgi:iron complex transport system substrate-binding protein
MRLLALSLVFFSTAVLAVRDDFGNEINLEKPAGRIVSLAPHLTELLYDAGAGAKLVGAVDYSDYPEAAKALPRVGSSAAVNLEALLAVRPDLVVAWPSAGTGKALERIAELGIPVFRSEPRELEDIASTLERLGTLAGTSAQADHAAAEFRTRAAALRRRYSARPSVRVFYEIWDRPLQTVNGQHLISKVIRLCGGENVFADLPLIAPEIDPEAVLKANPEVILGSASDGTRPEWLDKWKAFPGLLAAARGQLYSLPADLLERHTPRVLDGAQRLCRVLEQVRAAR